MNAPTGIITGSREIVGRYKDLGLYVGGLIVAEENGEMGEQETQKKKSLEQKLLSVISIAGLGAGIFFLSSNLTGNAIADLTTKTTSFIGAGLLIVGLVAGFFWIKSRKKK